MRPPSLLWMVCLSCLVFLDCGFLVVLKHFKVEILCIFEHYKMSKIETNAHKNPI